MIVNKKARLTKTFFFALLLAAILLSFACEAVRPAEAGRKRLLLNYDYKEIEKGLSAEEALADLEISENGRAISLSEVEIEGAFDPSRRGAYELLLKHGEYSAKLCLFVDAEGVEEKARFQTLDELALEEGLSVGIPSEGKIELLVIPIGFSNKSYDGVEETLEKAFNGTPEQTGWHSLSSFYAASSFGKLDLHATVLPVYQTGKRWRRSETKAIDEDILTKAIAHFDDRVDYSAFDANGDGTIDCVYLIYLAPYDEDSDLWWAFENEIEPTFWSYDGVRPRTYLWMSIEFFSEPILYSFDERDDLGVSINAETLIHETGHALGLDDYYDYGDKPVSNGGLGYLNMMDGNQGDHDPFSKAILGWIEPTFVYKTDYAAVLSPFEENGDALIISKTGKNSYFQEYFIVCYYTPTGAFELKSQKDVGIFSESGVLIYHINAALKDEEERTSLIEIYETNNGEWLRLIEICEADGDDSIDGTLYAENDDLFRAGDAFSPQWSDGTPAGFTLTVLSLGDEARLSVIYDR